MKKILLIIISIVLFLPACVKAEGELLLAGEAKSALMLEEITGEIIFEKNADEKLPPASMTKIMSMLLVVEAIEKGVLKWDDMLTISANASSMGGSQILLETGEQMSVEDLFKGVAIASGNDAIVALAEAIAGTQDMFVNMMNERAKELGVKNTNFKNVHGLDAPNHFSTARDMALMARELVKHEKVLEYTSIYETYLRENLETKIWLVNTNKLVRFYKGVDGLKTGFTESAGYCLTATAKKNGMRLISIVMGEATSTKRNAEISEMFDFGFAQYTTETLLDTNSVLGKKEVDKGKERYIEIVPKEPITFLNKKVAEKRNTSYQVKVNNIKAPVKKGDKVGTIEVYEGQKKIRTVDLTIKNDVAKAGLFRLYFRHLKDIVTGQIEL